jgi:hypothetical protein
MGVSRLVTGAVFSDGGIAPGTPERITGGVFVVHGAFVDLVRNCGIVTTYGPNDMVLDNWGTVDHWIAEAKVTSHGPTGRRQDQADEDSVAEHLSFGAGLHEGPGPRWARAGPHSLG